MKFALVLVAIISIINNFQSRVNALINYDHLSQSQVDREFIQSLTWSPEGDKLAIMTSSRLKIYMISDMVNPVLELYGDINCTAFSNDGNLVAVGGAVDETSSNGIWIWDLETKTIVKTLQLNEIVRDCVFDPGDDNLVSISGRTSFQIKVWSTLTGAEITSFVHDEMLRAVVPYLQGVAVISGGEGNYPLQIWDAMTNTVVFTAPNPPELVGKIAFNPNSSLLAAYSSPGVIRIWNIQTNKNYLVGEGISSSITDFAFTTEGNQLAISTLDGTLSLWDIETELEQISFTYSAPILNIAVDPLTDQIAFADLSMEIWIWDAELNANFRLQ